jgi:RNA polymerase sigma-70 factor (ECF subfamily)
VQSFENVVFAARAGAEWAWARIYEDLAPPLAGYLRAHGAADPDDLVAEVFLQVVRGLDGFSGPEPAFRAWVFTIAHRRLVDDLRRRSRRPVVPVETATLELPGGDVTEDAFARLDAKRVTEAIASLPRDQQSVLLLRIIGDLTIEQIAEAVGKRPGAVKALQRRALRKLETAYPFPVLGR